ncbi:MAG: alpha-E domain-containing protein [Abitibacteriaceae bacterium]|nr:alpha-E domain-containing protein [Abditibacteriaceae bacterium]MBV9867881.1 alpha-E domain-containing protein [Abditibacteriaceae bacterium]
MLSRVAESLFWMARYYERAENTARLMDVNINMMLDMGEYMQEVGSSAPYWNPIIRITSPFDDFRARFPKTTQESAIEWLTWCEDNPNSILVCIGRARENARAMRDAISSEMWEQINTTYLQLKDTDHSQIWREGAHSFFGRIRMASQLFQGLVETTMLREEGWQWIQLGKYLERADATTRLVDVKYHILLPSLDEVGGPIDNVQWIAVLKSCSAYEAYQKRNVARITPSRVAGFLVLDHTFPRAVRFCFDQIRLSLRSISVEHGLLEERSPEIIASHVRHTLDQTTMTGIIQSGLHQNMIQLQDYCGEISQKITQTYFQGALRHAA